MWMKEYVEKWHVENFGLIPSIFSVFQQSYPTAQTQYLQGFEGHIHISTAPTTTTTIN